MFFYFTPIHQAYARPLSPSSSLVHHYFSSRYFIINRKTPSIFPIRGGSRYLDEDEGDEDVIQDDDDIAIDDDDLDFDADAFDSIAEDDFSEDSFVSQLVDGWKKTPPFTKAYLTASLTATMIGYLTNKNDFPSILLLDWKPIITRLQIWRPFTAFLNIGPLSLGYLMTAQFVWTYMATLERLNHNHPYDFWFMIAFGCISMVAGYSILQISPRFLGHNLSTFLVYVWSRYHEGLEVNMFELFNTRAEMLPWFFLLQTFLLEGELPILDLLGIVFGHIYHHYKTTNVLKTPQFIINWYNSDGPFSSAIRQRYKEISSDFEL